MPDPTLLPLEQWSWVVVNSSGGKDSQTALRVMVEICDAQGYPRDRIVVSHQNLGRMEWPGALDLVKRQTEHYGLRLEVSAYRNKSGGYTSLLDYVRKRKRWPDNKNRFCTSEFKRGPGGRVLTKLSRERPGDILQVFGYRSEESKARQEKTEIVINSRFTNSTRRVVDYLPIHGMTSTQVWESIQQSGVPHAVAYDLGMPRYSCVFCVFAPESALKIAGKHNLELLRELCDLEKEIGHDFKNGKPLRDVLAAVERGELPSKVEGNWSL